jgi:uncharacterized membrane protein (UPF0127 family)
MSKLGWMACGLGAALAWSGCRKAPPPAPAPSVPPPPTFESLHLNHALPKLKTLKLWLGPHEIEAELALKPVELATGMMFRKEMGENEGMLFVFGRPYRASFYMKNTYVPLSLAYIDSEGAILEIRHLQPLDEKPVEAGSDQVQYVLEMNQGWFERKQVGVGTVLRTEYGSLFDTFFKRSK